MNLQPILALMKFSGPTVFLLFAAYLIVRFGLKRTKPIEFHLATLLVFLAEVVGLMTFIGITHKMNWPSLLIGSVMIFLACVMGSINLVMKAEGIGTPITATSDSPDITWVTALGAVSLCAIGLSAGLWAPPIEYDVMTYHLFFPARWIQEGALTYIPTVFGDLAPTYAPSNAELVYAYLGLPFHSDALARSGQFLFFLLGVPAIYLLAKKQFKNRASATIPVALAILCPVVFRQAFSAEVDLAMAATFVVALYYLDCYRKSLTWQDALLFGIALGLCLGIKFVALTFCIWLVVPFIAFTVRKMRQDFRLGVLHLFMAGAIALALCGFWYIRNWIVAGNPLFPLDLPPLFDGLFNRDAMNKSVFHIPQLRYVAPVWFHAFGPWMAVAALGGIGTAIFLTVTRKVKGFEAYVLLMPVLVCVTHFVLVPYNSQYRFLMPAVLLAFLPYASIDLSKRLRRPVRIFLAVLIAITLFGLSPGFTFGVIRFPRSVLIPLAYLPYVAGILLIAYLAYYGLWKMRVSILSRLLVVFVLAFALAHFALPAIFYGHPRQIVAVRPNPSSTYPLRAWAFANTLPLASNIAYTGTNAPYHLLGRAWQNRVVYVNTSGSPKDLLHDFYNRCQKAGNCPDPGKTDKPGSVWIGNDPKTWVSNLQKSQIDYLFVFRLSANEARYIPHDSGQFPMEHAWATQEGQHLRMISLDPGTLIYQVNWFAVPKPISDKPKK
jgi:4-amino-4-deoxy-L-arabinose transferase-like glycosyltransferase